MDDGIVNAGMTKELVSCSRLDNLPRIKQPWRLKNPYFLLVLVFKSGIRAV